MRESRKSGSDEGPAPQGAGLLDLVPLLLTDNSVDNMMF